MIKKNITAVDDDFDKILEIMSNPINYWVGLTFFLYIEKRSIFW
jgi:hypothetical protein